MRLPSVKTILSVIHDSTPEVARKVRAIMAPASGAWTSGRTIEDAMAAIDGLIGTVKGDTLELTFGGQQEEKIIAVHADVGQAVQRGKLLFELDHVRSRARMKQAEIAETKSKEVLNYFKAESVDSGAQSNILSAVINAASANRGESQ